MVMNENYILIIKDFICYRTYVFIMNGIGIYTTWTVVASLLNLAHCLRYVAHIDMIDTSNVSLSILLVLSVVYFATENTILDQKLRFLGTPYLGNSKSPEIHIKSRK